MNKSREKSNGAKFLVTMIIGVIPEIFFAYIVGELLDIAIWQVWLAIQGIVLVSVAAKSLLEYVVYRFIWKNGIVENITESLSAHTYPNPKKYSFNTLAQDYFGSVMTDDEIEIDTRLDAAYTLGTIGSQTGFLNSMRIESAMSQAIDKYHRIKYGGKEYIQETFKKPLMNKTANPSLHQIAARWAAPAQIFITPGRRSLQ